LALACLALAGTAGAAGQEPERGGGYKKITAACVGPDGEPVSPCDVEFKPNVQLAVACMGGCRCVTATSGICQKLLRCCGHQGSPPQIKWDLKATSIHGVKTAYFWTSCGWTCDESKLVRFEFGKKD